MKPAPNAPAPTPTAETIVIEGKVDAVSCDGGGGPLGHPLVYYAFEDKPSVECLYCDRVFVRK